MAGRLIGEYEARLKTEPNNLKLVRELAELYAQKNQFERSLGFTTASKIRRWATTPPWSAPLPTRMVRRFDFQLEQLDSAAPVIVFQIITHIRIDS